MKLLLVRFLLVQSLLLWQGGFVFYSAVVVPIGTEHLGSAGAQGAITAKVTLWLNLFGWLFLVLAILETTLAPDPHPRRGPARWMMLTAVGVGLCGLHYARTLLNFFMDPTGSAVQFRLPFRLAHQLYLCISTIHWLAMLAWVGMTLLAWRATDRLAPKDATP